MTADGAHVRRLPGDFSADELAAVLATLTGTDPDAVCQVAGVVVLHGPDGVHELKACTSVDQSADQLAAVLRHAADHLQGICRACARRMKERARRERH